MSGTLGAILGTGATGGWLERFLRPASIRGRAFWILGAQDETARRWITHEFPGRDEPWHEDLGLGAALFEVEGLLIGDDVVRQAQQIRAAAAAPGGARLVHPWYGTQQVVILACAVSLSANEGRVARFRLKLQKLGSQPAPSQSAGLLGRIAAFVEGVRTAIDDAVAVVQETVEEVRAVLALPDQLLGSVIGIAGGLAGVVTRGISGAGLVSALSSTVTGRAIAALAALGPEEAADPGVMTARVRAVAVAIAAEPSTADAATPNQALRVLADIAAQPVIVAVPADRSTPTLAAIADRVAFIAATTRLEFATAAATAASIAAWDSREAALADRDLLADALALAAEEMAATGFDDAWRAALSLRTTVIGDITERAAALPRLRSLNLAVPLPASLVAFGVDPDALATVFARGTAIAARNGARHPGFLGGGRAIEVLK